MYGVYPADGITYPLPFSQLMAYAIAGIVDGHHDCRSMSAWV